MADVNTGTEPLSFSTNRALQTLNEALIFLEEGRHEDLRTLLPSAIKELEKLKEQLEIREERDNHNEDISDNDTGSSVESLGFSVSQKDLSCEPWEPLGHGGFAQVFKAKYKGCAVAVKVLKTTHGTDGKRIPLTEGKLLRHLSHDNIVAFRGMGDITESVKQQKLDKGLHFIVMEYIRDNLSRYVVRQCNHENQGLPVYLVWDFARQIANGLEYLHTLGKPFTPMAHRDLKPDNILLDTSPMSMRVKLADFGLAYQDIFDGRKSYFNIRWAAPEIWNDIVSKQNFDEGDIDEDIDDNEDEPESNLADDDVDISGSEIPDDPEEQDDSPDYESDLDYYTKSDIYSYGMVLAYCLTAVLPWGAGLKTAVIHDVDAWDPEIAKIKLPTRLAEGDPLKQLISRCYADDAFDRPKSAKEVVEMFFTGSSNPYKSEPSKAEFFFCGFLKNTQIFVADSLVDESSEGYYKTGDQPQGYPSHCLICEVEVEQKPYHTLPCAEHEWEHYEYYRERFRAFKKQARQGSIEDNPAIALKSLITPREGELEAQEVRLKYAEGTYVHHRAMRDVWRELTPYQKEAEVPSKSHVHPAFSTSFGLHVAVLTADDPPKFFFCRRANRVGMASPREYTCGAVESVSKKDCFFDEEQKKTFTSLLKTAARGLEEELRVELIGDEINVICLTTVYLKFDTHEWGMCGFVNLADHRIAPERRLTYTQLQSRFVGGPKDKFEHDLVEAVDFTLESMMDFVRQNFNEFSSSGKLVVVKVLQSFFGVRTVEWAFQSIDPV